MLTSLDQIATGFLENQSQIPGFGSSQSSFDLKINLSNVIDTLLGPENVTGFPENQSQSGMVEWPPKSDWFQPSIFGDLWWGFWETNHT